MRKEYAKYPSALGPALRSDAAGFLHIDRAQFRDLFARDVYAKRMGARTTEVEASHVPFISHPGKLARLIERGERRGKVARPPTGGRTRAER